MIRSVATFTSTTVTYHGDIPVRNAESHAESTCHVNCDEFCWKSKRGRKVSQTSEVDGSRPTHSPHMSALSARLLNARNRDFLKNSMRRVPKICVQHFLCSWVTL